MTALKAMLVSLGSCLITHGDDGKRTQPGGCDADRFAVGVWHLGVWNPRRLRDHVRVLFIVVPEEFKM